MKSFAIFILLFLTFGHVEARTYYLSNKGNDAGAGSITEPWQTLDKFQRSQGLIQPGDSILFERGGVFPGTLVIFKSGIQDSPIYIGSYGSGKLPIITGAMPIKNWRTFKGNIWVTDWVSGQGEPVNLFVDGKIQPLGRYPNTGYRPFTCSPNSRTKISDNSLSDPDGYWDHSEVVVKSSRWTLDNLPVSSYADKAFNFSVPSSYKLENGFGYFIQKHLSTLDQNGEWFFDPASRKIYFYGDSKLKPGEHIFDVSVRPSGVQIIGANDITIENLSFKYQAASGISLKKGNAIFIKACVIAFSGKNGLEVASCDHLRVENTIISDAANNGIESNDTMNSLFINNRILRTGLSPGAGSSGDGNYIALHMSSNNPATAKNIVEFNTIDSTGYSGIDFRTAHTEIKNNFISNFCMTKDDGAGIYTWGNTQGDNTVEGNIVVKGIGSYAGTNSNQLFVQGIYIDDGSGDIMIKDNTIAYCAQAGIFIHNSQDITMVGNTLIGNGSALHNKECAQLYIKHDALAPGNHKSGIGVTATKNTFVSTEETVPCLFLSVEKKNDLKNLGRFDRNQYSSFSADNLFAESYHQQCLCEAPEKFDLKEWQEKHGEDMNSSFKSIHRNQIDPGGNNLVANGSLQQGTRGWMVWPDQTGIELDKAARGQSLKVKLGNNQTEALLYHAGIPLITTKLYRLSFSARAAKKSKIEFVQLMANAPFQAVSGYTCFSVDSVSKTFVYYFQPTGETRDARVNFKTNVDFWIDKVSLQAVESVASESSVRLFYNATANPAACKLHSTSGGIQSAVTVAPYRSLILFD